MSKVILKELRQLLADFIVTLGKGSGTNAVESTWVALVSLVGRVTLVSPSWPHFLTLEVRLLRPVGSSRGPWVMIWRVLLLCTGVECVVAYCSGVEWVVAHCSVVECVVAHCSGVECVVAYCSGVEWVVAHCSVVECVVAHCSGVECVVAQCSGV